MKPLRILLFIWQIFHGTTALIAQKEAMNWYFGSMAGLTFSTNPPSVVPNSNINFLDGGISYSDSSGNLLFYTGGAHIYNAQHIAYATTLHGSQARMYGTLVTPRIHGNYNVFTLGFANPMFNAGLKYAIVSPTFAANTGSVIQGSTGMSDSLRPYVKLAGVKHCNKKDTWVVIHDIASVNMPTIANSFYAFRVTDSSIHFTPVISPVTVQQPNHIPGGLVFNEGCLKFSPNGRKAVALYDYGIVELYDFDQNTGVFSNPIKIDSLSMAIGSNSLVSGLGVEFSPDGSKLYVSYAYLHANLCQFDLSKPTLQMVRASKFVLNPDSIILPKVYTYTTSLSNHMALQVGINGKIYCANPSANFISVINHPNLSGTNCGYLPNSILLGVSPSNTNMAATCASGLPNYVAGIVEDKPQMVISLLNLNCAAYQLDLPSAAKSPFTGYLPNSVLWNFGDTLSGASNTSTLITPTHQFSSNGAFKVQCVLFYNCGSDTLTSTITVTNLATPAVVATPTICQGEVSVISIPASTHFTVNNQSTSSGSITVQPTISTLYTITTTNSNNCKVVQVYPITVKACAGLDGDLISQLKVYPIPAKNTLCIDYPLAIKGLILDLSGRMVFPLDLQPGHNSIDMTQLDDGIYIVDLEINGVKQVHKIIKSE